MEDASKHEILEAIALNSSDIRELRQEMKADKQEVLEAINAFAEDVDGKFYRLERDMTSVTSTMVTKDYMEGRLAAFTR